MSPPFLPTPFHLKLACLIAISAAFLCSSARGENLDQADRAIEQFQEQRAVLLKPIIDLEDNYDNALQRLAEGFQEKGDLEAILAIKQERDSFRKGRFVENPPAEVARIRTIFQRELQKRRDQHLRPEETLLENLFLELEKIKSSLTKEGKIEDALTLNGLIEELKQVGAITEAITDDPILWEMKTLDDVNEDSQAGIAEENGDYVIRLKNGKNAGQILADRMFSPPFVARWVVKTDSHNIRIYMLGGRMILSHENGDPDLEMFGPGRGKLLRFKNAGRIAPDEFHEIEYEVREDSFQVSVNGEVRAEGKGDFRDLKGSISLGPGAGSVLTLETFEVRAPVE